MRGKKIVGEFASLAQIQQQNLSLTERIAILVDMHQARYGGFGDLPSIIGGIGQLTHHPISEPGFVPVEHSGADTDTHPLAHRMLRTQFFTSSRCIGAHRFANWI